MGVMTVAMLCGAASFSLAQHESQHRKPRRKRCNAENQRGGIN
jgi:hypothetical protein